MAAGGLKMIQNMLEQLPASERKIAEFILENPQSILNSTVNDIGIQANTSGAAVIRLCKSLGINGFQDLKVRIAGDLVKPVEQGYRDIEPGESFFSIVQKTTSNSIQSIRDSEEIINHDELERAVHTLSGAQNVHFFGIGASSIITRDAQQKFLRIQKNATAFTDTHLVATLIANANQDDVVFGISHSGETQEVIKVMALAKERGVKTISLTKYGQSSVSSLADIKLFTAFSGEAPFRSAATSSRLSQLFLIDILFLSMATVQYDETITSIDKTREPSALLKKGNSLTGGDVFTISVFSKIGTKITFEKTTERRGISMAGENKILAEKILEQLGGPANIENYTHCMTRLRVTPKDDSIVNQAAIKKIDGVMGVVEEETLQIILGPGKVNRVTEEFGRLIDAAGGIDLKEKAANKKAEINKKNATPFKLFLRKISSIFIPLIPALVASGLITGITKAIVQAGWLAADSQLATILSVIGSGLFGYLGILVVPMQRKNSVARLHLGQLPVF